MSERWTNTANDKGELSEMLIQSLIETAVKHSYEVQLVVYRNRSFC